MARPRTNSIKVLENNINSRAVGYVRVSTDEQGLSVESQRERIKSYCIAKDLELVSIFEDIGVSGTTEPARRDGLPPAMKLISEGGADILIVVKNDRIARRASFQKEVIYSITARGSQYISLTENVDTTTPAGKLYLSMLAEFAEYEVELIRERTKSAINHLRETGQAYSKSMFGYTKQGSKKNGDAKSLFVADPLEQEIIQYMISLYDEKDRRITWQGVSKRIEERYNIFKFPNTWRRIYLREKQKSKPLKPTILET
jgi:DNA invertase Pin-like site-specific DNA recombinase